MPSLKVSVIDDDDDPRNRDAYNEKTFNQIKKLFKDIGINIEDYKDGDNYKFNEAYIKADKDAFFKQIKENGIITPLSERVAEHGFDNIELKILSDAIEGKYKYTTVRRKKTKGKGVIIKSKRKSKRR